MGGYIPPFLSTLMTCPCPKSVIPGSPAIPAFRRSNLSQWSCPVIRAAVASFGFVYPHPMADGNGRLSRFLINDVLRRDGAIPAPVILPISATITNSTYNKVAYDQALERFSRPLMHHYATCYRFGESRVAEDGVEYNLHFDAYDEERLVAAVRTAFEAIE